MEKWELAIISIYAIHMLQDIFFFFQTFKPLVDSVGLYKQGKGSKLPVEFLSDLKLDFQDCNKLTSITVSWNLKRLTTN